jgi:uncharacterized cupredoxin-like copper-binding protein
VIALTGALASAAVLFAACSSGTSAAPPPTTVAAGPTASSPAASAPGNTAATAPTQRIAVQMTEFHLALPSTTLTAGSYTFDAVNAGRDVHALSIDGPGVDDQRTAAVEPGASAPLNVTLAPGTYDLYCPVGNHKAMGMDVTLTVTGPGAGPAPASPTGATGGS